MVGQFNDFAMRMTNIVHRFQADQDDIQAVWGLVENGRITPTVDVLGGPLMPASSGITAVDECDS